MTVSQLRDLLALYPPDMPIAVEVDDYGHWIDLENMDIRPALCVTYDDDPFRGLFRNGFEYDELATNTLVFQYPS